MSDQEKESLKAQGKCLICKESGHYARDCPKKKSISIAYNQVTQKKPWQQRTPFQGSRPWPNTAALEIMRPSHDNIKYLIPQTAKISCAAMVQINGNNAQILIDPCTMHGNLISNQFCDMYKIPTEPTEQKILGTAIKGSKSYINAKATVEVHVQGHKENITFYVANLNEWNAILGNPALTTLRAVMNIAENQVSIYSRGKEPLELQMLDKQTMEYPSTAAQYIQLYAEEVTDYSEAETYARHRPMGHLQNFLKEIEGENETTPLLERLSPIEEETEPEDAWDKIEKEDQEIDKEIYAQLGNIPDNLAERIATYKRNLDELLSIIVKEDWEVQADAEDNNSKNISIAQEEYDADSDSTDSEIELQQNWALDDYWRYMDSDSEQDFQNESEDEPPNINQIKEGARNLHITIPKGHHAYENWIQQRLAEAINDQIIKLQSEPNITCNYIQVEEKWDPIKEFPHLFPDKKPLSLPPLRYPLNHMQHYIKVRPGSTWQPKKIWKLHKFKHHVTEKINQELKTGRLLPSQSTNCVFLFTKPKANKVEPRFLIDCIPRNEVTISDPTPLPNIKEILNWTAARKFRTKLDLTDGYHNIRIHPDSVKHSTIVTHIGLHDSQVMQQGDKNAPATMMRVMNHLLRHQLDRICKIYIDDIIIATHTYAEHKKAVREVMRVLEKAGI